MNCKIVRNRLTVSDEALKVLLSIAWKAAHGDKRTHPSKVALKIGPSEMWRLRFGQNWSATATILINEKFSIATLNGVECRGFNEVFTGLAAWAIAGILKTRAPKLASSEAVYTVREMGNALKEKIAAVNQRLEDRANRSFAKEVLVNLKRDSLEFKLNHIAGQEKTWLRKARLAETKLKGLCRRRSALLAADKRRNANAVT